MSPRDAQPAPVCEALRLVEIGVPVFPCKPDKSPLTKHGFKDASREPDQVRAWWSEYPQALVAVPTGPASGFAVLDIDVKPGKNGFESLRLLGVALPDTRKHQTQSGGAHFILRTAGLPSSTERIAKGVDVRDEKGYAIWWPASGLPVENPDLIADVPEWMIELAGTGNTATDGPQAAHPIAVDPATLRDLTSALTAIRSDDRDLWVKIGHALKTIGEPGRALWLAWSQTSDKWKPSDARQWNTFAPTAIGHEFVFAEAQRNGWLNPMSNAARIVGAAPPRATRAPAPPPERFPEPFRGAMAALHDAILRASPKPQPRLATLACLVGMAGAVPGVYALEDGSRCNLYGLGVAKSGDGKDAPQMVAREIVAAAGGKLIGQPASGEGLEDALESRRGMLCVLDEVAHVFEALNAAKAPAHMLSLARNLLTLYSAGRSRYTTRQRAKDKKSQLPAEPEVVEYPCFSLLGYSTPEKLGQAATTSNVEDGLLGRHLFAFGQDNPKHTRPRHRLEIPEQVARIAQDIGSARMRAASDNGNLDAILHPEILIATAEDADALLADVLDFFHKRTGSVTDDPLHRTLFVRSYEKVARIAGVLAVWDEPVRPVIQREHVAWALQMVNASNDAAQRFLTDFMHGGEVQRHAAEIKRALDRLRTGDLKSKRANGVESGKVMRSELLLAVNKRMNAREFATAIEHLEHLDEIEIETVAYRGRTSVFYS